MTRGQRNETTQEADFSWSNHPANFQQRRRKLPIRYPMLVLKFDQYLEVVDQGAKSWVQPQDGHLSHFDYVNNRGHKMHASNFHLVKQLRYRPPWCSYTVEISKVLHRGCSTNRVQCLVVYLMTRLSRWQHSRTPISIWRHLNVSGLHGEGVTFANISVHGCNMHCLKRVGGFELTFVRH